MSRRLALFRYRLYQVDSVINQSIVHGILSTAIVGIYLGVVWGIGSMLGPRGGLGVSLAGVAVVALVANPARLRMQRIVNRAMFGDRDDPYQVLHRLKSSLECALSPSRRCRWPQPTSPTPYACALSPSMSETPASNLPTARVVISTWWSRWLDGSGAL